MKIIKNTINVNSNNIINQIISTRNVSSNNSNNINNKITINIIKWNTDIIGINENDIININYKSRPKNYPLRHRQIPSIN